MICNECGREKENETCEFCNNQPEIVSKNKDINCEKSNENIFLRLIVIHYFSIKKMFLQVLRGRINRIIHSKIKNGQLHPEDKTEQHDEIHRLSDAIKTLDEEINKRRFFKNKMESFLLHLVMLIVVLLLCFGFMDFNTNKQENIGLTNQGQTVKFYDVRDGLMADSLICVKNDDNRIWVGSIKNGVALYDSNTGFKRYHTGNSLLPNQHVTSIQPDNRGNVWMGTFGGGIARFNGSDFSVYSEKDGLLSNFVHNVYADGREVFVAGEKGISWFNGVKWENFSGDSGLSNTRIIKIKKIFSEIWAVGFDKLFRLRGKKFETIYSGKSLKDAIEFEKELFIATMAEGIIRQTQGQFIQYTEKDGLPSQVINCIHSDGKTFLISTDKGFAIWNGDGFSSINPIFETDFTPVDIELLNGYYYIATKDKGLAVISQKDILDNVSESFIQDEVIKVKQNDFIRLSDELDKNFVVDFSYDNGNLYVATLKALYLIRGEQKIEVTLPLNLVENDTIGSIYSISGQIYLGTNAGIYRGKEGQWQRVDKNEELKGALVNRLRSTRSGILASTDGKGVWRVEADSVALLHNTENSKIPSNFIYDITEWDDRVLYSTEKGIAIVRAGSFEYLTDQKGLCSNVIQVAVTNPYNNDIWIGTRDCGLSIYDGLHYRHFSTHNMLPGNRISDIFFFENRVYIATHNGLASGDIKSNNFSLFSENEVYPLINRVLRVDEDSNRLLWVGTGKGLYRLKL